MRTFGPVVALVPAHNRADSIGDTVRALLAVDAIDRVVVIDDGSNDDTTARAFSAYSANSACGEGGDAGDDRGVDDERISVLRLRVNGGKGGAIRAAITATPEAGTYLLIDADLGRTAAVAEALLRPIAHDQADLVIGLPTVAAGGRGGFGAVRTMAAKAIRGAVGFDAAAPLSGQRALRAELLRSMPLADRFGLETAMTIDAVRSGARVMEVPVDFDHRHTGRTVAGFLHRARQGGDIVRALWSRRTSPRFRIGLMIGAAVLFLAVALLRSSGFEPSSVGAGTIADRVVVFGVPRLSLNDLGAGNTPAIDRLVADGAVAATSVRTLSGRPSSVEAYASLGAGGRVRAGDAAADAYGASDVVGLLTATEVGALRTGRASTGKVIVTGLAETVAVNENRYLPILPAALGETLHQAGKTTGVVGTSDTGLVELDPDAGRQRPAAIALADLGGSVTNGTVTGLLQADPTKPFGVTVNRRRFLAAAMATIAESDVTVIDPGEMDRVFAFKANTGADRFEELRVEALRRTDELVGAVSRSLPENTLLIVVGMRPATRTWELTPTVLVGPGVLPGYAHSPSTKRLGLITLTDLSPTILAAIGLDPTKAPTSSAMIGHALRFHPTSSVSKVGFLRDMNDLAGYRERIYLLLTKGYVIFQVIIYSLTMLLFSSRGSVGTMRAALTWIVLAVAAWPLATFVFRMIPHAWVLGPFGGPVMIAVDIVMVMLAQRARRHPLSPLSWILFATVAVNVVDVCSGAALQQSSILGYSPHTAARFTGIGNAAFAALASTCVLWSAIHVHYAPRRREALIGAALVCGVVLVADGAPFLGSDVGGILTLVPVFGLLLYVMSGRALRLQPILLAGVATVAALAVAAGLDYQRPAGARTHLGRLIAAMRGDDTGSSTFLTTLSRKLATNVRVFTGSFWTWIVPIIAIVLLFFLIVQHGWERDISRGTALRAGVVAALLCGLLGFAVNDSGSVVTALVFVYLGPFITLLALQRDDRPTFVTRASP